MAMELVVVVEVAVAAATVSASGVLMVPPSGQAVACLLVYGAGSSTEAGLGGYAERALSTRGRTGRRTAAPQAVRRPHGASGSCGQPYDVTR